MKSYWLKGCYYKAVLLASFPPTEEWNKLHEELWGPHGRDRIVVGFTASYAISAYHH